MGSISPVVSLQWFLILCQWQDESKKHLHPVMIGFVITTAPLWVVFMHVCTLKCALLFFSCCSACVFVFINTAGYSYRCLQEVVATDSSSSDIYISVHTQMESGRDGKMYLETEM